LQTTDFLIEWVIASGALISTIRAEIAAEVKLKAGLTVPVEHCRLRTKKWKEPDRPLIDCEQYEVSSGWELYLQVGREHIMNVVE